jgi:hypothetical protein
VRRYKFADKFGETPEDRLLAAVHLFKRARSGDDYARKKVRKMFGYDVLSRSDADEEQESIPASPVAA